LLATCGSAARLPGSAASSRRLRLDHGHKVNSQHHHIMVLILYRAKLDPTREAPSPYRNHPHPQPTHSQQPPTHITTPPTHHSPPLPCPGENPDHHHIAKRDGGRDFRRGALGKGGELPVRPIDPRPIPRLKGRQLAGGFSGDLAGVYAEVWSVHCRQTLARQRPWGRCPQTPGPARRSPTSLVEVRSRGRSPRASTQRDATPATRSPRPSRFAVAFGEPWRRDVRRGMAGPARARRPLPARDTG